VRTLFKPEEFEKQQQQQQQQKRLLCVEVWTKKIVKMGSFENDGVTRIMRFPCLSFPRTQIQKLIVSRRSVYGASMINVHIAHAPREYSGCWTRALFSFFPW